jgi:two-component system, OmpR family, sensor histidine kinase KdpD
MGSDPMPSRPLPEWPRVAAGLAAVAAVTAVCRWLGVVNAATVSTTFLLVVLVVAATSRLWVAVTVSVVAVLCFNFFFLPPLGTFVVAEPQNWLALISFLAVSLVASNLSAVARARTAEALGRRDEQARLFDLSRDVLVLPDSRAALTALARAVSRRFDLEYLAIALPAGDTWDISSAGAADVTLDPKQLAVALAAAQTTLEFDAYSRTYSGHREVTADGRTVRLVPLRVGTRPIGLMAAAGRPVDPGTLDALAGVVAIAIERATLLQERKAAELTRQSDELKSALLASIGHDLRTPLTAIRVAAANLREAELGPTDRREQSDLIQAEVERLARLFQNLIDLARLDSGAVARDIRRVHPSEIVAAAREQVEHLLRGHALTVSVDPDVPVRLDPRLTASALAHLLENAAQYSPEGSTIEVRGSVTGDHLEIAVRDHGPGIAAADLPRVFDRFYRGVSGKGRTSGTGMGLWIARGFLAAQHGRVRAENAAGGGACVTLTVPATNETTNDGEARAVAD